MLTLRIPGTATGAEGIGILQSLQAIDRGVNMQGSREQELVKKIVAACLNCRHFKQGRDGKLHCEVSIARCPKKWVRKWRGELERKHK